MAHTRRTLRLDSDWDVMLDESGKISLLEDADATAQNVANECRLFRNDSYFIQDRGIPYFILTLGQKYNTSALRSYLRQAALRVDDVKSVDSIDLIGFDKATRTLSGEIRVISAEGGSPLTVVLGDSNG